MVLLGGSQLLISFPQLLLETSHLLDECHLVLDFIIEPHLDLKNVGLHLDQELDWNVAVLGLGGWPFHGLVLLVMPL